MTERQFKFGRRPRRYDPRVPHFSALTAAMTLPAPPASVDYTTKLPPSLGMFHNDALGDCTCAAVYHAFQVWSANAQAAIDTEPDDDAELLYEQACGYNPSAPSQNGQNPTDQGGDEQSVLTYVMLSGAPVGAGGANRHRIAAFVEIDPRNFDDVKLAIATGGLVYLGFEVPDYMPEGAGSTWDVEPGPNCNIVGGHAVIAAGYDAEGLIIISWGAKYRMTWAFWSEFVDECYLLADQSWIESTGKSPAGLSLTDLETQMQALNDPGASGNGGSVPMRAPTGLMAPVPHNPRLAQLARDRDLAHARATAQAARADTAERVAAEVSATAAQAVRERDEAVRVGQQLVGERDALRAQLGASESARGTAEDHAAALDGAAAAALAQRNEHAARIEELLSENGGLRAQLGTSESARENAERACQDARQAIQHAQQVIRDVQAAARQQGRR